MAVTAESAEDAAALQANLKQNPSVKKIYPDVSYATGAFAAISRPKAAAPPAPAAVTAY